MGHAAHPGKWSIVSESSWSVIMAPQVKGWVLSQVPQALVTQAVTPASVWGVWGELGGDVPALPLGSSRSCPSPGVPCSGFISGWGVPCSKVALRLQAEGVRSFSGHHVLVALNLLGVHLQKFLFIFILCYLTESKDIFPLTHLSKRGLFGFVGLFSPGNLKLYRLYCWSKTILNFL